MTTANEDTDTRAPLPTPMRLLAYARVHTKNQDGTGSSIQLQVKKMEQYAYSKEVALAEVYTETRCVNSTARPECSRMIAQARMDPQVTGIMVADFSYLNGRAYSFLETKKSLADQGISIVSLVDTTTPEKG